MPVKPCHKRRANYHIAKLKSKIPHQKLELLKVAYVQRESKIVKLVYTTLSIAGMTCEGIVDTGAQRNILPESWVIKNVKNIDQYTLLPTPHMVDIAGQEISVLYSIKLPIKVENTFESEVIFDVYSGETALFGLPILNRLELVLFCSEKDTYLYYRNTPYFAYNLNVNLEKQDRIVLAANTERKIPLFSKQIKKKGKVLILVSQKDTEDKIVRCNYQSSHPWGNFPPPLYR